MRTKRIHRRARARAIAGLTCWLAVVASAAARAAAAGPAILLPPPDWQDFDGRQRWPRLAVVDSLPEVVPLPPAEAAGSALPQAEAVESALPSAEVVTLPPVRSAPVPGFFRGVAGTTYASAEVLALQRDNQSCDMPLVTDVTTGETLLATGDLNPGIAPGGRAFVGFRAADGWGCEAGYLGVYGMTAKRSLNGAENLQLAGPLNSQVLPFQGADSVTATYVSGVNSAEFNLFASCCDCGGCAAGQSGGWCIDWLGGFRYVSVEEQAGLVFTCCTTEPVGPFTSRYDVLTSNNLFGGQFGGRVRRSWDRWAVEAWAKAGAFANAASQSQRPIVDPTGSGTVVRDARGASGVEPAMVADLALTAIYRIDSVWGVRVGYNALWIGGLALAPDQWNFSTDADAGTILVPNGGMFLNGASLGLEARW